MAKNKVICDTDVIIDYWDIRKPRHDFTKNVINNVIGLNNVLISAITQIELLIGAANKVELSKFDRNFQRFGIVNIDNAATILAVHLIRDYTLSHGLALPDALIAASSIVSGKQLFTYNLKDCKFIDSLILFKPDNQDSLYNEI